jgi:hypothetical protein
MITLDGMLMVGSTARKIGKTDLVCSLIKKFSKHRNIIGIKVTTIDNQNLQAHGHEENDETCFPPQKGFCITEEVKIDNEKDTARLLAAGASRVFWLRVLKEHLMEGAIALVDTIGQDTISICESNSLRQVIVPGLFLMLKSENPNTWKSSVQCVIEYVDKVVVSDGNNFDLNLEDIRLVHGKWKIVK